MTGIRYITRTAIDDTKWNACIDTAANGLIYGYTVYLDAMCSHWDALVLNDYVAVMPLPWRRKGGFDYLYRPFAIAQLGLFGNTLTADLFYAFLKNIPARFRYWDFPLNFQNHFNTAPFSLIENKNYVLPLNRPYETIRQNYHQNIRRNIRKAVKKGCTVEKDVDVDVVIDLAKKHKAQWGTKTDLQHFKALHQELDKKGEAVTYAVVSASGTLLASSVFFYSHNRAYYIFPGNPPDGRTTGASHFLIDQFIQDHAGQNLTFDFEGSDVPGLQFFYSSFGALEEPYVSIRHNRLPWYLKWLKR